MKPFLVSMFVVSALLWADGAEAQWRPERPYRGLFAGGIGETSQLLTASGSLGTGWSDNLLVDPGTGESLLPGETGQQFKGAVQTVSGVVSYSLNLDTVGFGATVGTTGQYYSTDTNQFVRRDYAHAGTSVALGKGFSAHGALSYEPYSLESTYPVLFEPGLGDTSFVDEDFPSSDEHFLSYSAGVAYLRRISRRMSVQAGYDYHVRPEVQGEADRYARQTFRGRVTRELGKGLGAHAGYIYSHALYDDEGDDDFGHHTIDVGLDFSRAFSLSLSRRTTLSFSTGTSIYQTAEPTFHFRLIGAARLSHEMGRTWNATVSYDRGFGLTDTWSEPVFSDSATAGVGGLIAPRTELRFSGRALFGGGVSGSYGDIQTMNGSGELSFALSRHVNTALTYVYYRQQLADDVALVEGFPPDYDGQSIRLSVNVWAPLFQRARRP